MLAEGAVVAAKVLLEQARAERLAAEDTLMQARSRSCLPVAVPVVVSAKNSSGSDESLNRRAVSVLCAR